MKVLIYYIGKAKDAHANALAADYVKRAFAARHPLRAVFKTAPSVGEYN